jgi:hypothetical protein
MRHPAPVELRRLGTRAHNPLDFLLFGLAGEAELISAVMPRFGASVGAARRTVGGRDYAAAPRSYSALNSQPTRATKARTYIQTTRAMAAPIEPYITL